MSTRFPILQFGTSRFLQAHADLFISEALARGEALGPVAVVETTGSPASVARVAAFAAGTGYPVRIRGLKDGVTVDETRIATAIRAGLSATRDWQAIRRIAIHEAEVILSNTGDRGFDLSPTDDGGILANPERVPASFPAKLLALLHARFAVNPGAPLSLFPCELIVGNGDRLRTILLELAAAWNAPPTFSRWLEQHCRFANALVDRIVSEPIEPVGAVAEPYALWAVAATPGLVLPCRHEAIVVTDDLDRYERLKLFLLNLGHTVLAEGWQAGDYPLDMTVYQAMNDNGLRSFVEAVWREEVLPVFAARGEGETAEAYLATVRERFLNPFLVHRLADIAQNHAEKVRRRLAPVIAMAGEQGAGLAQPRLKAIAEARNAG